MSKGIEVQLPLNMIEITGSDTPDLGFDHEDQVMVQEEKAKLAPPPRYQVIMLDDDYTPMEFVVDVLQKFFAMNREKATQIMLTVHTKGRASCGTFSKDIAETKVAQTIQYARENHHPLMCEVEKFE